MKTLLLILFVWLIIHSPFIPFTGIVSIFVGLIYIIYSVINKYLTFDFTFDETDIF